MGDQLRELLATSEIEETYFRSIASTMARITLTGRQIGHLEIAGKTGGFDAQLQVLAPLVDASLIKELAAAHAERTRRLAELKAQFSHA
jgi:hypothetical protein